ncbi:MAG: lysozyme [Oscillospiraceae bacterium]|nr:lysozyme [Oscillospiraceae bacterium]
MHTSQRGVNLIKSFEGLSLHAVKLQGEQYWTIGYGHSGPDVAPDQSMNQAQAEALLRRDLRKFERWVTQYAPWPVSQNEFDALVSFCYNGGPGMLRQLVKGHPKQAVADRFLLFTGSASELYREGLRRRRKLERALFLEEDSNMERWKTTDEIQDLYLRREAQRLVREGVLAGKGQGSLDLTEDMLRTLLMAERLLKR